MSKDSAGAWDAQAKTFDEAADHGLSDPGVRAAWADLLSAVIPEASAVVADLGCGTGSLSVLLASAGHQVTGVDFSTSMVEVAKAKAAASNVHVEFIVGDAAGPPVAAGTFDVVLGRHVLWALPEPAAARPRPVGPAATPRWASGPHRRALVDRCRPDLATVHSHGAQGPSERGRPTAHRSSFVGPPDR